MLAEAGLKLGVVLVVVGCFLSSISHRLESPAKFADNRERTNAETPFSSASAPSILH